MLNTKIEDYINSEEFFNFIHEVCYNAILSNRKVVYLPEDDDIRLYLVNFFFHYNFAYVTLETVTIKDDITLDDLDDAYQTEVSKLEIITRKLKK